MKVFIANFGRENYEWPRCLANNAVATMNDEKVHQFWDIGDRDGYIEYCLKYLKTAAGETPTRSVASRWFNLMTVVAQTSGDFWVHREKNEIWWTISLPESPTISLESDPKPLAGSQNVYVCRKPCVPWLNRNRKGARLTWDGLHPKAKDFLFTEGTLQQLAEDNADYTMALIDGASLEGWHNRPEWMRKARNAKTKSVKNFDQKQKIIWDLAYRAFQTARTSNGQEVTRTIKDKECRFSDVEELRRYITALIAAQDSTCVISGLPLLFGEDGDDPEMTASLDRIDSDGHYERGNLQIVCRFINRWKSDSADESFRRLIAAVQSMHVASLRGVGTP